MAVQKITFNQIANTGGLNGQVLAANSTAVYWKTISSGGFSNGQSISVNNFVVTGSATIPGYETRATANSRLANTNSRINLINTNLTGTNTALRTLISDRLQVANAVATYQTISTERAALANTNARITLVNTNLTGTNTALRTLISDRLQVANATATYETKATADSRLANTNAYIATKVNTTTFNSALANTNSFIKSQLANTNAYIATRASWTALTGTNTALRTLISDRLQVANAAATYETKTTADVRLANTNSYIATRAPIASPTFTGTASAPILASTQSSGDEGGQIDLALAATNTTLTGGIAIDVYQNRLRIFETGGSNRGAYIDLSAASTGVGSNLLTGGSSSNGFSGILVGANVVVADSSTDRLTFVAGAGMTISANPTTDTITFSSTGGGGGFSNGQSISVTNLVVTGNATVSGLKANGSLGTSGKVLKTNGTTVYWGDDNSLYVPRVFSNTSQSTLSWNSNSYEQYQLTGMTQTTTINADSGSPSNGQKIMFRFKDNGNSRTISWTTGTTNSFRAIGVTLPTTTVVSKTTYVGCVYNSTDSRWDVIAVAQET